MKKLCIMTFLLLVGLFSVYAQDLIVLRDGNMIEAIVTEISPAEIRYKRYDHQDGPTIVLPVKDVLSIRYRNGKVETLGGTAPAPAPTPQTRQQQTQQTPVTQPALGQELANQLGIPVPTQQALNMLPAIRVAGRSLKFTFAAETWTANANGRPFSSGIATITSITDGFILTLSQTHTYVAGRQIDSPDITIYLEFKPGPPASLKVIKESELPQEMTGKIAQDSETQQPSGETAAAVDSIDTSSEVKQEKPQREKKPVNENSRLKTIGLSIGTAAVPALLFEFHGTIAPANNLYFEFGCDLGFINNTDYDNYKIKDCIDNYFSLYPFANIGFFIPFKNKGGWYAGTGVGIMFANYTFIDKVNETYSIFAFNLTTGFNLNVLNISYTFRFGIYPIGADSKLAIGYVYRFK